MLKKNLYKLIKKLKLYGFTVLEILITITFLAIIIAPILNTLQLSEKFNKKAKKTSLALNLAYEMLNEISTKSFNDPDGDDTYSINLKPSATHEEYLPDNIANKIQNGTDEVTNTPRFLNETILNRAKYYDDIDDYDGYNTDETILPTDMFGRECVYNGKNIYEDLRVKVKVKNDTNFIKNPNLLLNTNEVFTSKKLVFSLSKDSKYLLLTDPDTNFMRIFNTQTKLELDNQPNDMLPFAFGDGSNTFGTDPINLSELRETPCEYNVENKLISKVYNLGPAAKTIIGPFGDRFYTLHKASIFDTNSYSAISTVDMNSFNTPEVSFHKLDDLNLIARDLRSNSINQVLVDEELNVYAATSGAGLMKSSDNGKTWVPIGFYLKDGKTPVTHVNCLAKNLYYEDFMKYSIILAGGKGGLLVIEKNGKKIYRDPKISDLENVITIATAENGYTAIGTETGLIYVSTNYGRMSDNKQSSFYVKKSPLNKKINALVIDNKYRLWLANDNGIYYSLDAFSNLNSENCTWNLYINKSNVNALYIDKSQTNLSPFIDIPLRRSVGIICAPSLIVNHNGIFLFYLDDSIDGGNGTNLTNPKLFMIHSKDFGKTWSNPIRICDTQFGKPVWTHNEVIDRNNIIHVLWQAKVYKNQWNIFYQRSNDLGKTWLNQSRCIFNQMGDKHVHSLYYNNFTINNWQLFGSNKIKFLDCAINNNLCCSISSNINSGYNFALFSPSNGLNWYSDYYNLIPKPTGGSEGYIESTNIINNHGKVVSVVAYNINNLPTRLFFCSDFYGQNADFDLMPYQITNVLDSISPVFNEDDTMVYSYIQKDAFNETHLYTLTTYFPYIRPYINKIEISPVNLYQTQFFNDNIFVFFALKPAFDQLLTTNASKMAFMTISKNYGNSYITPIFIDYIYSEYDQISTANYNSKIYIVKLNSLKSPDNSFKFATIPNELMFFGTNNSICNFDCDQTGFQNIYNEFDLNTKINGIFGDNEGNILIATSNGLYMRNIRKPNVVIDTLDQNNKVKKSSVLLPPTLTINNNKTNCWIKLFDNIYITSVLVEKNGVFWVSTLNDGIYRSNDYGASWEHIEAKLSNITDLIRAENGTINELNTLFLVTKRFNVNQNKETIFETLFLIYDLKTAKIKNYSVVGSEIANDPILIEKNSKVYVTPSSDGLKIFYYNPNDSSIYIKENDIYKKISVSISKDKRNYNDFNELNVLLQKNDKLILSIDGRLKSDDLNQSFLVSPIQYFNVNGIILLNNFEIKINNLIYECGNFYFTNVNSPSEAYVRLKPYINVDSNGNQSSYISYGNYHINLKVIKEAKKLPIELNNKVSGLYCSPDNKSLYIVIKDENKILCLSNIENIEQVNDLSLITYNNLPEPSEIIFVNNLNNFKPLAVCKDNIYELTGEPLLPKNLTFKLDGFIMSDNNELIFYDSNLKNIYKMPRILQKVVTVSVIDKSDNIYSISPIHLTKKFFYNVSNNLGTKKYLKYNYIYTSRDFPNGILSNQKVHFKSKSDTDELTLNVYVIDSIFNVKGDLILDGNQVIKFATANKSIYEEDFSGKSHATLNVKEGNLLINDSEENTIIFTSIDDPTFPPSIYNAKDNEYKSENNLPNIQLRRSKFVETYKEIGGPKHGDFGYKDATFDKSYGCLILPNNIALSLLPLIKIKYGLIYLENIFGTKNISLDIDKPDIKLLGTNVYVVTNGNFIIDKSTVFKVEQGTIIKIDPTLSFIINSTSENIFPKCLAIFDGSSHQPIIISPTNIKGLKEGQTPSLNQNLSNILNTSCKFIVNGTSEIITLRKTNFNQIQELSLTGSNTYINSCNVNLTLNNNSFIDISIGDYSVIENSTFILNYPNKIKIEHKSTPKFINNKICFSYGNNFGTPDQAFIECKDNVTPVFSSNVFYDGQFGMSNFSKFQGSKFNIYSIAYFFNNYFLNNVNEIPVENGCSTEITLKSYQFNNIYTKAVITALNNTFVNNKLAFYVENLNEVNILKNRIINNNFYNVNNLMFTDNNLNNFSNFQIFNNPTHITTDSLGNIYVLDEKAGVYYKFNSSGNLIMRVSKRGIRNGELRDPNAIAVNLKGEVYVIDKGNQRIQKFDKYGNFLLKFGEFGDEPGKLVNPVSIAILEDNNKSEFIYVLDSVRKCILKFSNNGSFIEELKLNLNLPINLSISNKSQVAYVIDKNTNKIHKISLGTNNNQKGYKIITSTYSITSQTSSGFVESNICDEGEYFEITVMALNEDGTIDTGYVSKNGGSIIVETPTHGILYWEGKGITDNSNSSNDNGAKFSSLAFSLGIAKFYVRCPNATGKIKITIFDNINPLFKNSAIIEWKPENVPLGLISDGINLNGFKRYFALNDPTVKFIKIPASNFERGDNSGKNEISKVKMSTYYISETLITNEQFFKWQNTSKSPPPVLGKWQFNKFNNHPVTDITYDDAKNYCYWLIKGENFMQTDQFLPTEAQYEKAMRGPDLLGLDNTFNMKVYPFGLTFNYLLANNISYYTVDERPMENNYGTTPVLKYQPQGYFGLYDICGNAYSWCRDWYNEKYIGSKIDPINLIISDYKVIKGGSWKTSDYELRCSTRNYAIPTKSFNDIGIRPCISTNIK